MTERKPNTTSHADCRIFASGSRPVLAAVWTDPFLYLSVYAYALLVAGEFYAHVVAVLFVIPFLLLLSGVIAVAYTPARNRVVFDPARRMLSGPFAGTCAFAAVRELVLYRRGSLLTGMVRCRSGRKRLLLRTTAANAAEIMATAQAYDIPVRLRRGSWVSRAAILLPAVFALAGGYGWTRQIPALRHCLHAYVPSAAVSNERSIEYEIAGQSVRLPDYLLRNPAAENLGFIDGFISSDKKTLVMIDTAPEFYLWQRTVSDPFARWFLRLCGVTELYPFIRRIYGGHLGIVPLWQKESLVFFQYGDIRPYTVQAAGGRGFMVSDFVMDKYSRPFAVARLCLFCGPGRHLELFCQSDDAQTVREIVDTVIAQYRAAE